MSEHEHQESEGQDVRQQPLFPSQSELFEDLRRIGELEDQKRQIQTEIDQLTSKLKDAIPELDQNSLLYQMLSASLTPKPAASAPKTKRAATKKKTPRKRATKK